MLYAGRILHERGRIKAFTLNEQVDAWMYMVESVEEGYALTIYDYANDLGVRRWLDRARSLVTRRVSLSLGCCARMSNDCACSRQSRDLVVLVGAIRSGGG